MNKQSEKGGEQYIHQMSYKQRERLVGFFVFFGFILLLSFIVISVNNQHLFEKKVLFYIEVNSSDGISPGSIVTALGTEVGSVSKLTLTNEHKIRVTIEIYKAQRQFIRKGVTALVNRLTNIGNAQIEISSALINAPILEAGATIPVQETPSLNELMLGIANLIQLANNKNLFDKVEGILPKVEQTLGDIHAIVAQIASGHGVLGAAVFDQGVEKELKVVVKSGAEILSEAEGIISLAKQRLVQLKPVLHDMKYISKDARAAAQGLPEMVVELNAIIAQAKQALTLVNGELQEIPGIAFKAKRTLSKTDKLIDSVQKIWPLSTDKPSSEHLIPPHSSYD
ncbi:MAG: MlaD family protein [Methylococcales bacterium]